MTVDQGWTLKSIMQAVGLALATEMIILQLYEWRYWPEEPWSLPILPAVIGSAFLASRHRRTGLLITLVFFPILLALSFYAPACIPLSPTT